MNQSTSTVIRQPFTELQLELLKIFAHHPSEQELIEIKRLLSHYYMQKAIAEADRVWKEKGWSEETMKEWSQEHMRTPYKAQEEFLKKEPKN